ncbi:hypothetical protein ACLEBW_00030 [Klebsiella pneumoniae]|uniref:hypothetical protein n=1 Tax=Klebsiella pneumoniae TaxID=573 RepID=UPI003975ED57
MLMLLRFPRYGQAVAFQLRHHVLRLRIRLLHQVHQAGGDFLCRLLFVAGQIAGLRQRTATGRVVRVTQPPAGRWSGSARR